MTVLRRQVSGPGKRESCERAACTASSLDHLTSTEEEVPDCGDEEVLVRVRAASLNCRDLAMVLNEYPVEHRSGLIPLSDGAGEIVEIGGKVTDVAVGDRVVGAYHPR